MHSAGSFELLSTRLFPKFQGADKYRLSGLAARCDWVVLSDGESPNAIVVKRAGPASPRHLFVSLREPFAAFDFLFREVLPEVSEPFVLVTGSEDATVPRQLDFRWRKFSPAELRRFDDLLEDPRLLCWYAENLDEPRHPKLLPLPLGAVFAGTDQSHHVAVPVVPHLESRPLRVLCAHRTREGPQWEERRRITELCRGPWAGFCTVLDSEVPEHEFWELVHRHAFVICAAGGGLDPSPKAWLTLLNGAIPVARSSALDSAYDGLPMAFVPQWAVQEITEARLREWRSCWLADFDAAPRRAAVLRRLGMDHWWSRIDSSARPPPTAANDLQAQSGVSLP